MADHSSATSLRFQRRRTKTPRSSDPPGGSCYTRRESPMSRTPANGCAPTIRGFHAPVAHIISARSCKTTRLALMTGWPGALNRTTPSTDQSAKKSGVWNGRTNFMEDNCKESSLLPPFAVNDLVKYIGGETRYAKRGDTLRCALFPLMIIRITDTGSNARDGEETCGCSHFRMDGIMLSIFNSDNPKAGPFAVKFWEIHRSSDEIAGSLAKNSIYWDRTTLETYSYAEKA